MLMLDVFYAFEQLFDRIGRHFRFPPPAGLFLETHVFYGSDFVQYFGRGRLLYIGGVLINKIS